MMTEEMPDFWALVPGYLTFLRFREGPTTQEAIAALRLEMSKRSKEEADQLIKSHMQTYMGWRINLVGCAIALMGHGSGDPSSFWEVLENWTWVSPQVAATLSIIDPIFEERAQEALGKKINTKSALSLMALIDDPSTWEEMYGDGEDEMLGFVPKLTRTWKTQATLLLS